MTPSDLPPRHSPRREARTMTSLIGYLSYRDAPAAIAWLEAIGFEWSFGSYEPGLAR
jgi:hypothetical protein